MAEHEPAAVHHYAVRVPVLRPLPREVLGVLLEQVPEHLGLESAIHRLLLAEVLGHEVRQPVEAVGASHLRDDRRRPDAVAYGRLPSEEDAAVIVSEFGTGDHRLAYGGCVVAGEHGLAVGGLGERCVDLRLYPVLEDVLHEGGAVHGYRDRRGSEIECQQCEYGLHREQSPGLVYDFYRRPGAVHADAYASRALRNDVHDVVASLG